ncbi:MAG: DUF3592 domain-containing protein [Planctomycetaceae bacterium]|nr:DUF3592 domain-containing protein [Planctomycetaceae bacterium]
MDFDGDPSQTYFELVIKTLLGLFFVLGMPFGIYSTIKNVNQGRASSNWTETTVTVVKSEVVTNHSGRRISYNPSVKYTYEHNGKTYSSSRIAFQNAAAGLRGSAEDVCAKYSVGSKHTGYFDPENPEEAVLETGVSFWGYALLLLPPILLLAGIFMVKENGLALRDKWQQGSRKKSPKKKRKRARRCPSDEEDFDAPAPRRRRPSQTPPRQRRPRSD